MAVEVFFHSLAPAAGNELAPVDIRPGLKDLVGRLGLAGTARRGSPWGLKVQLGAQGHPPAVDPAWARAVAVALAGPGTAPDATGSFCFDTLSITTGGLDVADSHLGLARVKGYGTAPGDLPYLVTDGPDLDSALARAAGICLLTPIRPHPHVGLQGAVTNLGIGLADREGKILLHKDVRPSVNTPLCAGCGSCLAVCLFDAIEINAGRAFIDHEKCTGCGECMNVCFMAGISPEEAAGIPRFQEKVAAAALAAQKSAGRSGFFNILVRLDRHAGGARSRGRNRLGDIGVLASLDPVALDQATWDLIVERTDGPLANWSGFQQEPETLLNHAEQLGLGSRTYRLTEV